MIEVNPEHVKRLRMILVRLDDSLTPQDMNLPVLGLHLLKEKYDYVRSTPPWRNNSRAGSRPLR